MKIADVYDSIYKQQMQESEGLLVNVAKQNFTHQDSQTKHEDFIKTDEENDDEIEQSF